MARRTPRAAEARALRSGLFRQRVVKLKKGKGAYSRRSKHPKNWGELSGGFGFVPA